jgi:putative toxin-antitoxin system antitoxin component (TIGR02293 family)
MATTEELVEALGGKAVLKKRRVHTLDDLARFVQEGLPYQALVSVMEEFRLGRAETQKVLMVPPRTLARRRGRARMKAAESDRLVRLARVGTHAVRVFGTDDKAAAWLHRPNRALNNRTPLNLLQTDLGAKQVEDVLGRIEHGVLS